jgi:hypothetical protein
MSSTTKSASAEDGGSMGEEEHEAFGTKSVADVLDRAASDKSVSEVCSVIYDSWKGDSSDEH